MSARKLASIVALLIMPTMVGCEITASMYVQKDWNTDPSMYKANDMVTKAEVKVTKLVGRDAKKAK